MKNTKAVFPDNISGDIISNQLENRMYHIEMMNKVSQDTIIVEVSAGNMFSAQDIARNNNPGWFVYRVL